MRQLYATILFFVILFSFDLSAQTSMSSGTLNQCGGTYLDPAGTGNYVNNANVTQTICSPTAGQCITLQFTAFNLENNFDYLRIYNGTSAAAPLLATLTGTTIPGQITSTTGCLTLVFTSDGSVTSTGWVANVICAPCSSPPPPPPGPTVASDCSGAVNICTNSSFQIDPNGSGSVVEFTSGSFTNPSTNPGSANAGCLLSGELNSTWMVVNIATTGTLEFSFGADGGTGCLDWIMWPYNGPTSCTQIINNSLQPVRCNWNGLCETFTGVATPLPAGGDATNFEPELNVTCGQRFLICLSNYSSQTTSVPLNFFGSASVSCTTFTPITVNSATICPGATATLTAAGGNTYSWSPGGQTTASINVSPASTTTYTVTGTGACGTGTATSTVTVLPANDPSCVTSCTATASNTGPYCAGSTIQLNGTGGGTYSWTGPNGFTSTLQNPTIPSSTTAASGTYTLTINLSGCIATATTTVTVNPLPTVSAPDAAICLNGSTTLNATGANTYTWTPTTGLSAGTGASVTANPTTTTNYTLTGTSAAGCVNTDIVTITVNPLPTVNPGAAQTVCAGTAVTLAATGASTYSWNNGVTQGVPFTPASTATYTVTGTSAAGCTNTANVTVTVNPIPTVNAGLDVSICTGGSTTLTATGATTYSWTPGGQTTASITVSPASTTTYTVVGTSLGCTSSDAVVVTVLTNAPINAGPDVAICAGQNTVLTATGGTTYNWNNGLGSGNGFTVSPSATTTYTVVGTDANGCTGTDAVVVTINPLPTVNAGLDQTVCAGTAVTLTATGASTYTWSNGVTNGVSFTPVSTVTYSVTGTTAAGCTGTDNVVVTVNPLPTTNAGVDQTVCAGTPVTLTATGASTYSWNNGVSQGVAFTPTATTTYTVTGTTTAGCTTQDQVVVTVNALPVVGAGNDVSVCNGTSVTLTGTGANTYSWNNGITNGVAFTPSLGSTTYTVTGTSAAGCTGTDQVIVNVNPNPSPVINGPTEYCTGSFAVLSTSIPYSAYNWSTGASSATINATSVNNPITVTVTDANGCQGTSPSFTVVENNVITANFTVTICQGASALIHGINQTVAGTYSQTFVSASGCDSISNVTLNVNPLPAVNAGLDQAVCIGTSVTLTASGASTYSWNNAVQNGVTFTPAATTTYTVTGTSAQGCINSDQVVVTVNPLPTVSAGPDIEACVSESVVLTATGANTYSWNNGVVNGVSFVPSGTSSYTVTGTDINGCINTDQITVTVNPSPIIIAGPDQTVCVGTSVTLTATGGVSYSWDNGITNGVSFTPAVGTVTYTVNGTDLKGCVSSDQVVVTVNALPNVNAGSDQTLCVGGSVTLSGTGAQTYSWSNGVTNGTPFTPTVGSLNYTVSGTDQNGCVNTDMVTINVNPLPVVNAGPDQSVCEGTQVTLTANGASTYSWNGGVVNGVSFTPPVGTNTYNVTGTDVNGCLNSDAVIVVVNPIPNVFAGNDIVVCEGESVTLTASGANVYTWNNGVVNGSPFVPAIGTTVYSVTGTTNAGCIDTDDVSVTVNPNPVVSFIPDNTLGCAPLTVNFTNQTTGASNCVWSFSNGTVLTGCGTVPVTFTQSGCYDATLTTTVNGCTSSFTAENIVCVEEAPNAAFAPSSNSLSTLNTSVVFNNLTTGATSYVWDFGDNSTTSTDENPTHVYPSEEEGQYTVMLIASSPIGCVDTAYSIIQIYEELIFYVPNTFTPDNDNFNPVFKPIFTSGFDPFDYNLMIFNRWGEVIFESNNAEVGWDGTYGSNGEIEMCQDGTYTWKIEFKVTRYDERRRVVGHVNLLR
jgi:gliding motility-associated-like protein